jgi:hypothetical protein
VLRQTGFRISDVTALNDSQLIRRLAWNGWALQLFQIKTKEFVYLPITDELEAALRNLDSAEKDGKRFWS